VHPNDIKTINFMIGAMQSKEAASGISSTGTFKVKSQKLSERLQMRKKDGQFIWVEVKCKALRRGTVDPTKLLVFREVTEVVEQEMHAEHER
jgi:hypothetical protein